MSVTGYLWRMSCLLMMVWGGAARDAALVQVGGFLLLFRVLEEREDVGELRCAGGEL